MRNVIHFLDGKWAMQIHHTEYNAPFVHHQLADIAHLHYVQESGNLRGIQAYNALLKSVAFWESIPAEKVLIFQTDSIMLRTGIEAFLSYDYIGAPWCLPANRIVRAYHLQGRAGNMVGNGGFSLRSREVMLNITRTQTQNNHAESEEDLFFAIHIDYNGSPFRIPNSSVAYEFARDGMCNSLEKKFKNSPLSMPLAIHQFWLNAPHTVMAKFTAHLYPSNSTGIVGAVASVLETVNK